MRKDEENGGRVRRRVRGVGGYRMTRTVVGIASTGQDEDDWTLDYLLLYRSGNNGIPIMKWISLGNGGHRCTRQEILRYAVYPTRAHSLSLFSHIYISRSVEWLVLYPIGLTSILGYTPPLTLLFLLLLLSLLPPAHSTLTKPTTRSPVQTFESFLDLTTSDYRLPAVRR